MAAERPFFSFRRNLFDNLFICCPTDRASNNQTGGLVCPLDDPAFALQISCVMVPIGQ